MAKPPIRINRVASGQNVMERITQDVADVELVRLPLEQIGDRPAGDTRPLNDAQVETLLESIAVIGLIAPLAVDSGNRLLAGGHRRAALARLQERDLPRFNDLFPGGVPCRRFGFDSQAEPDQALTIEISENEKRRNYTRAEIRAVAEKLLAQGYSRARGRGNKQPLTPALMTAFGVSRAAVKRALSEPESNGSGEPFTAPKTSSLTLAAELADQVRELARQRGQTPTELVSAAIAALLAQPEA